MSEDTKQARFERVAHAVVSTLLRGGPEALKVATIARRAGVSRAWIYKYFGSSHGDLLAFTAREFGAHFADLEASHAAPTVAAWRDGIREATRKGLRDTAAAPWLLTLRFRYRDDRSVLGETIRDLEARHREKFLRELPPKLASHPSAARFSEVFTQARLGVYAWWRSPTTRDENDEDGVIDDLMGMLDSFIARASEGERP